MTPRVAAYETLLLCEKEKQYSNIAIHNGITKYRLEGKDRDFYTQLVYGVIEKQLTIDYLIRQYTKKSVNRLDRSVVTILRLSIYQIKFLDRIPHSAAVSEGVKLASRYASRAKGFINAILRRACVEDIDYPDQQNLAYYYSVRYSVSEDICRILIEQYPDRVQDILAAYNTIPTLCLQVNATRYTPQTFINTYHINADAYPPLPFAVKINERLSLSDVTWLENGDAFVQDVASQFIALVLDPSPDMNVIDVCSCPGGKSFSAMNLMHSRAEFLPNGKILACDLHESKLPLVKNGAAKLGFDNINTLCHDATSSIPEYRNTISRVICDVPCSGLGVIAKKPEIRYKDSTEIEALPQLQYEILKASSEYLKVNGILVYSTCTINKKENEDVVFRFLKESPDFCFEEFEISSDNAYYASHNGFLTLFPDNDHDGFFIAKIKRIR